MCGRAVIIDRDGIERIAIEFSIPFNPSMWTGPRYNVRPTEPLPVIRRDAAGQLELVELRWWLIPSWANEPDTKFPTFNARADTVADKPTFREPFRNRRCLVVIDGFYEWPKKPSKDKRPRLIRFTNRTPMTLAGLWDRWRDPVTGVVLESCTVITTEANELLANVPHDRMPVILDRDARSVWLDPAAERSQLEALLVPRSAEGMHAVIVAAQYVNYGVDDERCLEPVEPANGP